MQSTLNTEIAANNLLKVQLKAATDKQELVSLSLKEKEKQFSNLSSLEADQEHTLSDLKNST